MPPPPPPRQPYAFASSNPSAASSSQNPFYNRQQQPQPVSAPRRGYTAAPGAASAVSLLRPGQRDASSDSVVCSFHAIIPASRSHAPYFLQHSNPFHTSARGSVHTISDKVRDIFYISILAQAVVALLNGIVCLGDALHLMHRTRTTIPVAIFGIPGAPLILGPPQQVFPWGRCMPGWLGQQPSPTA